jgi:2-dehydro-3-deoxy-D-arabinonate dehydratase
MRLYHLPSGSVVEKENEFFKLVGVPSWDELVNRDDLHAFLKNEDIHGARVDAEEVFSECLAPIGTQEVWASGVTYFSSRLARMEESKDAGGGDFYSRVYGAERPEIFFKATPGRVVGPGKSFRIRRDSTWDVPEPELTLFATTSGKIVGYSVGNDVSSRSIEGENPLYLPQAKTFDDCACLGPCLYIPEHPLEASTEIRMSVERGQNEVFSGSTTLSEMKREPEELIGYLYRELSFPVGVFLMTGTGIVPNPDFTLQVDDWVKITIDGIGELANQVAIKCD